jgi:hypothetical protein
MAMDEAAKRRVRAGRMLLRGKPPAEVAAAVGAPRQTVYRWLGVLESDGIDVSGNSKLPTCGNSKLPTLLCEGEGRCNRKTGVRATFKPACRPA